MKKNKNLTYALVLVVIALWGIVFYRLYISFFSESRIVDLTTKSQEVKIKTETDEKFILLANYKDPFLGKSFFVTNGTGGDVKRIYKKKVEKVPEVVIDWSFISYLGLIKNKESKKHVALIVMHGKEHMVSEGEVLNEVSFLKNYKDSIKVLYQKKITFLRKQ